MSRLTTQAVSEATGHAAQLFTAIKGAIGKVPNAYVTLGTNSPVALETALNMDAALRKSSLAAKEVEVVKLAVSQDAQCDYCLAAHTLAGGKSGLSSETMLNVRHRQVSGDARIDALAVFAHTVFTTSGEVPAEVVVAVRQAGYSDAQIVDTLLAIATITFTNLFNRVNATTLDFPAAP
ncbi:MULTISPECIES: carboxymuconolactone decarboxylase family protein [unclassified Duganella]|uniref:carboxymuconolactone decarboxylase family protein n=1 Tax=unclassified Duganella TaxID=2636909 RepID=UPI000E352644|nr:MULTISPECIES: carboxymuconolactone decarboxylase family protein [unclassified Duganella]RFP12649.1 carboxymuconolactone decarboxylase family protein [Duganella sp. BJB475]RFP28625.1 carboxymuconolactone decarboxylase family protein [Duganella sp. BJB476]